MSHVATPRVQKAATKSAEPPIGLPIEDIGGLPVAEPSVEEGEEEKKGHVTDTGEEITFNDFG